ncbi:MAG: PAS domain S-box protein [bacterium]
MNFYQKDKIAFKILIPFMGIFTLMIISVVVSLSKFVHKKTSTIIQKEAQAKINTIRQHFDISTEFILREMSNLSHFLGPILEEKDHLPSIEMALEKFRQFSQHYALQILTIDGETIIESIHGIDEIPYTNFKSLLNTFHSHEPPKKLAIKRFKNNLALEGIIPIYKENKIIGFIRLFCQLGTFFCQQLKRELETTVYLLIDNHVIANSEDSLDYATLLSGYNMEKIHNIPNNGIIEVINFQGREEMIGFLPLEGPQHSGVIGYLMILIDTTLERDLSKGVLRAGTFYGIIGIVLLTFIGLFIAKSITRPLTALVVMARKIGEGDLTVSASIHTNDELEELALAFNNMAKDLRMTTLSKNYVDKMISSSIIGPLVVLDKNLDIQMINQAFSTMLRYNNKEIVDMHVSTIFADREHAHFMKKNIAELIDGETRSYETFLKSKNSNIIPVLFSESVMKSDTGDVMSIVCTAQDISERKHVEEQLHEKKEYLKIIWDSMQAGIIIINKKTGKIFDANPKALEMIGSPKEEVIASNYSHYIVCSDDKKRSAAYESTYMKGYECSLITGQGEHISILRSTAPIVLNGHEYYLENFIDVTERERTREALRQSAIAKAERQRLFSVLDVLPAFMFLRSSDFTIPFANGKFKKIFGDLNGKYCYEIMFKRKKPCSECITTSCIFTETSPSKIIPHTNGRTYEIYHISFMDIDHTQKVLILGIDITQRIKIEKARKEAESKLEDQRARAILSDRLRSLGVMATGIAHELNQPLMGVRGVAEHILLGLRRSWKLSEKDLQEKIQLIIDQTDRMTHVIEHTRMFARDANNNRRLPVHVNEVIKSSMNLMGTQLRLKGLTVEFDLANNLPPIVANPYSLEEVIMNIINNARDACIERKHKKHSHTYKIIIMTKQFNVNSHTFVSIEIRDNGKGIPQNVMPHLFTPFFTTKAPDKGTGLGLSISKSIIEDFKGTINIESIVGSGTKVFINLPVCNYSSQEAA